MGFREKMKSSKQDLSKRHKAATEEGQRNFGSIFNMEKVPKGIGFWSPRIGDNLIDIIPFFAGTQHPTVKEGVLHFMVRLWVYVNSCNNGVPYVSPFDNWNKPDPIREYMTSRGRLPEDEFKKVASKDRCAFLVWPHNTKEEEEKGIHIYEASFAWSYEKMKEESEMPMGGGHIPFSDPDQGKSFFFKLERQGKYTDSRGVEREGRRISHCKFLDRDAPIPEKILDQSFPLDEAIKMHVSYEELYTAFHGRKPSQDNSTSYPGVSAHRQTEESTDEEWQHDKRPSQEDIPHETEREEEPSSDETSSDKETRKVRRPPIRRPSANTEESLSDTSEDQNECPYGHKFGIDLEKFPDDCGPCPKWSECNEEEDRIMAQKSKVEEPPQKSTSEPKSTESQTTTKRRPVVVRRR